MPEDVGDPDDDRVHVAKVRGAQPNDAPSAAVVIVAAIVPTRSATHRSDGRPRTPRSAGARAADHVQKISPSRTTNCSTWRRRTGSGTEATPHPRLGRTLTASVDQRNHLGDARRATDLGLPRPSRRGPLPSTCTPRLMPSSRATAVGIVSSAAMSQAVSRPTSADVAIDTGESRWPEWSCGGHGRRWAPPRGLLRDEDEHRLRGGGERRTEPNGGRAPSEDGVVRHQQPAAALASCNWWSARQQARIPA